MHRKKVLVVDDDEAIRETIATVLVDEGYRVETAANGRLALEALDRMGDGEPALILLDVHMPEMTGAEVLAVLGDTGRLPHMRVVVLSATPGSAEGLGARKIVRKPVTLDALVALVHEHAGSARPPRGS